MQQSTEHQSPSPVTTVSMNKFLKPIVLVLTAIILVSILITSLFSNDKDDRKESDSVPNSVTTDNLVAPQLQKPTPPSLPLNEKPNIQKEDEEAQKLEAMRQTAPMNAFGNNGTTSNKSTSNQQVFGNGDANAQFMNQLNQSQAPLVTAGKIAHPATTLAQGTIIAATVETQIVSDLPGMVRAITSSDVYSEDGSHLLIPKGSRLIGQYSNSIVQGQERVFVVWQRLIRPDHIDIMLTSPGTDPLGTAGMNADVVDRHFAEQFSMAALFSLMSAGVSNVGADETDSSNDNKSSSYKESLANSFADTAQQSLQAHGNIKPTLTIHQGTKINVFVARDLVFWQTF